MIKTLILRKSLNFMEAFSSSLSCKSFNTKSYESVVKTKGDSLCPVCNSGFVKVAHFLGKPKSFCFKSGKVCAENCDYLIAVGSSLKVSPANSFIRIAKKMKK